MKTMQIATSQSYQHSGETISPPRKIEECISIAAFFNVTTVLSYLSESLAFAAGVSGAGAPLFLFEGPSKPVMYIKPGRKCQRHLICPICMRQRVIIGHKAWAVTWGRCSVLFPYQSAGRGQLARGRLLVGERKVRLFFRYGPGRGWAARSRPRVHPSVRIRHPLG